MKAKYKNNKGITLIALMVTVIVLLILAGITIAALTDDSGVITRAENAKNVHIEGEQLENNTLQDYENLIDSVTK